jgi:uncharacterized protein YjbI with pentapeptide repeats
MIMDKPTISEDPLYQLLRNENIREFNEQAALGDTSKLKSGDYRGRDLRNMIANGLDFSDAYFRNSNLKGIDFRNTNLQGASIIDSQISGCYFPDELSPAEILMSHEHGTRLRYKK